VDTLADKAMKDLGVQVRAIEHPYKLLLYEEGALSKAHRDTEKVLECLARLLFAYHRSIPAAR
jgi:hypothetical protein